MTKAEILGSLTEDQQAPVKDFEGACFILAGPGSGKTHTIVSRAQYMVLSKVDPASMIMFTFTVKAANEIKERVVAKVGPEGEKIMVGTYHSVCGRFLRKYADRIGFTKKYSIYDTDDVKSTLKDIIPEKHIDAYSVIQYISDNKNKMISPEEAMRDARSELDQSFATYYDRYQRKLKKENAMDFDDLIGNAIKLFEENPDILAKVNRQYRYIVADEFHDSCRRDIRLIELLAGDTQNVCLILDDDQSIYSFRGADIEAVLNAREVFPDMKQFILRRNFRSTEYIVEASRSLISHNKTKLQKEIFTKNEKGTPVIYFNEGTPNDEATRVLKTIMLLIRKYDCDYKDIAILYRMSFLSRGMEDAFLRGGIPYKIVSGCPFYSRKEIKDIMCYMRLLNNPFDIEAFKRIINTPKRGIGDKNLESILDFSSEAKIGILEACKEIKLKGKAAAGLENFNSVIFTLQDRIGTESPADFIDTIVSVSGYRQMIIETEKHTDATDRLANIGELKEIASQFSDLDEFIANISLSSSDQESEEEGDSKVQMMTMHASKGLEFKAVIIIGANEGTNPHWKSITIPKQLEEERRLFYVAMTRAKELLFITRSRLVMNRGVLQPQNPSRFIKEINRRYIVDYNSKK
jgi:DNA helicase-2/ATP-dependent DNA helicase PcrA